MENRKEIDLDELPKTTYRNKQIIDWINCIGKKVHFIYDDIEGWIEIVGYESKERRVTIKYKEREMNIYVNHFMNCKISRVLGKKTKEFKIEIGIRFQDDKRDITITNRERREDSGGIKRKYYKYKCNLCGFDGGRHYSIKDNKYKEEFWILENDIMNNGSGCSCCCTSPQIVVENINSIYYTDKWMIPIINDDEFCKAHTHSSNDKIEVTCPDCGKIKNKPMSVNTIYNRHSISCNCSDGYSYGHKYVFNLLEQLKQDFIDNYTFDWCKFYNIYKQKETTGEYDFVLEQNKVIIEVDGSFHRQNNRMNKQTKEESEYIDNEKDRLANEHGYKVIRIIYNDDNINIKNNILNNDKLNELFDLTKIDWIKCGEFACSNFVKIACDYKKNNPSFSPMDISKIIRLERKTIYKYLKLGNELGWCTYTPSKFSIK